MPLRRYGKKPPSKRWLNNANAQTPAKDGPTLRNEMKLEDTYTAAHAEALGLVESLSAHLYDLSAPDTEGLHWGNVGDLARIVSQLKEIMGEEQ